MKIVNILLGALLLKVIIETNATTLMPQTKSHVFSAKESDELKDTILTKCQAPRSIQKLLAMFLSQEDARKHLISNPKLILIADPATNRLKKRFPSEWAALEVEKETRRTALAKSEQSWQKFCTDHDIKKFTRNIHTHTLTTDAWNFVLYIPRYEWFDKFEDNDSIESLTPSKLQNVSRVFYAKQINDFIAKNDLTHIFPLKQWLVHIPWRPYDLNDDNYLVASEKIQTLPSKTLNIKRFQLLIDSYSNKNSHEAKEAEESEELINQKEIISQLIRVIDYAALWDIRLEKVFLIENQGNLKILFLDLEKPGLGGGFDKNFYHKDEGEVTSNAKAGHKGLEAIFELVLSKKRRSLTTKK
jgi:hypothetical protein